MSSRKHHYLPRYYLKGFTDAEDGFFVYDKQKDKMFRSGSIAAFYENDLNTVIFF
jgi:intein-encoded DNA endonuclease-like protein